MPLLASRAHPSQARDSLQRLAPEGVLVAAAEIASTNDPALRRLREHKLGRTLAAGLLDRHGAAAVGVGRGTNNEPRWPEGFCGSISHAGGLCVVAVAPLSAARSIGVDLELVADVDRELWPSLATARELARIEALDASQRGRGAAALFSAKEAAYKCVFPLDGVFLEFHDVELELDLGARAFRVLSGPSRSPSLSGLTGSFEFVGPFVVTLVSLTGQFRHFS